jgi:hypothetical protein
VQGSRPGWIHGPTKRAQSVRQAGFCERYFEHFLILLFSLFGVLTLALVFWSLFADDEGIEHSVSVA